MSKTRTPHALQQILPGVLEGMRSTARPSQEGIESIWKRLVGEEAAQHSWPQRLIQGKLLVEVENSGWMYTLSLRKMQLLQGLIELLGAGRVKALVFRIGERKDAQREDKKGEKGA